MTSDATAFTGAPAGTPAPGARRLRRGRPLRFRPRLPGPIWNDVLGERPEGGRLRAMRRMATALVFTLLCMPIQAVLLLLPGPAKSAFPRFYHRTLCWLIGLKLRVIGRPTGAPRTLYVSNHSSWLDILVLGATLDARFVSKSEVGTWPVIGWVAKLGRTVFVSRTRGRTGSEAQEMRARMEAGDSLILFPEGTTSDGARVLPFRSSFFAVANAAQQVQPVTLVYDRLGGLPVGRRDRPLFAWYGDMETASHAWRLLRRTGTRVTVVMHAPFAPETVPDRKLLAARVGRAVSETAATLRQNREVTIGV
ncbi:lysophospholipid acyltransferase family protein [Roseococcus suduntuyensis]|uniref:1-acyl-sn-glycerol-3-phosphate acyltransferase n=1 Tax=Roseococcus suduntuyensis TaxID=455361 RepID=A0A840A8B2_9PROT|nr:lysophospholipid acyltransferase family protein [Roseococcus suduntuyensis]MBB3897337.1 1-acyl-sn-glycerol-3-phosphate acyltransferase [Roseococcus suduntuyensis]